MHSYKHAYKNQRYLYILGGIFAVFASALVTPWAWITRMPSGGPNFVVPVIVFIPLTFGQIADYFLSPGSVAVGELMCGLVQCIPFFVCIAAAVAVLCVRVAVFARILGLTVVFSWLPYLVMLVYAECYISHFPVVEIVMATPLCVSLCTLAALSLRGGGRNNQTQLRCNQCKYDLTGLTTEMCPECGMPIAED